MPTNYRKILDEHDQPVKITDEEKAQIEEKRKETGGFCELHELYELDIGEDRHLEAKCSECGYRRLFLSRKEIRYIRINPFCEKHPDVMFEIKLERYIRTRCESCSSYF